jgi:predicted alpha/beta hydrolase
MKKIKVVFIFWFFLFQMNYLRIIQSCVFRISIARNSSTTTIPSLTDSYPIEATIFEPKSSSSNSICVVISEATGNRRQFYFPFAQYLSEEHNLHVITYDYRGIHEKKSTKWTLLEHWARRDCAGVLSYAFKNYNKVVHIGHSLGGNMHALLPPFINEQISRIVLISAANSYLMYHKWNLEFPLTLASLYLIREPLIWLYGYYPMRTVFRTGVDMPSNIIRQWAKWSTYRQCFVDNNGHMLTDGFNSVKCPILALNFVDDEYYTREAFDVFTKQFHQSSNIQNYHLPKGGHFKFFKKDQSFGLWKDVVRFIKSDEKTIPLDKNIFKNESYNT